MKKSILWLFISCLVLVVSSGCSDSKKIIKNDEGVFLFKTERNPALVSDAIGFIEDDEQNIIVAVPKGTTVTNLVPSFAMGGYKISPDPTLPQDFSKPITYTLTAPDKTTKQIAISVVVPPLLSTVCYVKTTGNDANSGFTPSLAKRTIQACINTVTNGGKVVVYPGSYQENINFNGKNIVVGSLFLSTHNRNYISLTTIIGVPGANASVVSIGGNINNSAALSGFTISRGNADRGGGISCYNAYPNLNNLVLVGNTASLAGGGIYITSNDSTKHVILKNIQAHDNKSYFGGGICIASSTVAMEDIQLMHNQSVNGSGGGFHAWNMLQFGDLKRLFIYNNTSGGLGGGINMEWDGAIAGATINIVNSVVSDNILYNGNLNSDLWGAGLSFNLSAGTKVNIVNSTIADNKCSSLACKGGGIYVQSNDVSATSALSLVNTVVWGNRVNWNGQAQTGLLNQIMVNLTPWNNSTDNLNLSYCDIQGDTGSQDTGVTSMSHDLPSPIFSVVSLTSPTWNGTTGGINTNINSDPLFVNPNSPLSSGYQIQNNSPCINTGTSSITIAGQNITIPQYDILNTTRTASPDIGAYEYTNGIIAVVMPLNQ